MLQLAVVTTGTLFSRIVVRARPEGLVLGNELLERLGVRDGDVLEIHTDGELVIMMRTRGARTAH